MKIFLFFIFILLTISLVLTGCSDGPGNYDALAQCLTEKDIAMYGTEWCSHCKDQKATFGKSFKFVNYVDCDFEKSKCDEAGVRGYPTWKINGVNYPGKQSLSRLAQLSGCELQ